MQDKILIIDDCEISRIIIEIELAPLKVPILKAENGTQALEILTSVSGIRVATVDMMMPDMTGLEMLAKLRSPDISKKMKALGNDPDYLIITDDHSEETHKTGFKLGALQFFNKPIKKGDLIKACRRIISPLQRFKDLAILVVEDSDFERAMLVKILKTIGVKIYEASDGPEALQIARDHRDEIGLILSDLHMHEEDGDVFFKKARYYLNFTEVPMIIISVDDKPATIVNLYKCGATDYIKKPYIIEEVLSKVEVNLQNQYLKRVSADQLWEMQSLLDMREKFLASHTHDLRSPLHNILGCAELLVREQDLNEDSQDLVNQITSSGKYMTSLVNDLLNIKKSENIDTDHFQLMNFTTLLTDVFQSVKYAADIKGLHLSANILPDLYVEGEKLALARCFTNILSNAIKFTSAGGEIDLETTIGSQDNICITIKDNGIGIEESEIEDIFNEYTSTSQSGTNGELGTGLGLSIVKQIMKSHGGAVKVESDIGKGSTFSLFLKKGLSQQKQIKSTTKVLIADDQPSNLILLQKLLSSMKIEVLTANSGTNLLDLYHKEDNVDIIITDIHMPGLTGIELAAKIRHGGDLKTKIIALTGSSYDVVESEHIDRFLQKPVTFDDLWNSLASF
jgi:signal transduction histidine kinase